MKRAIILPTVALGFCAVACSSDDEPEGKKRPEVESTPAGSCELQVEFNGTAYRAIYEDPRKDDLGQSLGTATYAACQAEGTDEWQVWALKGVPASERIAVETWGIFVPVTDLPDEDTPSPE